MSTAAAVPRAITVSEGLRRREAVENAIADLRLEGLAPEAGQKVISTGPYALVRHPMYLGALVMLLGVPLALGCSGKAWSAECGRARQLHTNEFAVLVSRIKDGIDDRKSLGS